MKGNSTIIGLNTLILTDISVWRQAQIDNLLTRFTEFIEDPYECNNLLLCPNPLMAIALTLELLSIIGQRMQYKQKSIEMKEQLLALGEVYNSSIESD